MTKKHEDGFRLNRRDLLKGAASVSLASALSPLTEIRATSTKVNHDLIRAENEKVGTTDWLLQNTRVDPKTRYRCPWIEGYCSRTSVRAGGEISFHVSTNPPSPFTLDIYRMGYYGGDGGRLMQTFKPFQGETQPDPPIGKNRVRECQWSPCAKIKIPRDWLSGVYLGKLTARRDGCQSYVIFIVRDDRPAARALPH